MCLIVKSNSAKVATTNLLVFKFLYSKNISEVIGFKYTKGKFNKIVNITEEKIKNYDRLYRIKEGYHARLSNSKEYKTELFMIPKGTLYYIGEENYVFDDCFEENSTVSETIIFLGRNNWFNRIWYKLKYKAVIL